MDTQIKQGLEGVVAAATRLSSVDGEAGVLLLAGFPVEEIAPRATFEELTWLLWNGSLPTAGELEAFRTASRRAAGPAGGDPGAAARGGPAAGAGDGRPAHGRRHAQPRRRRGGRPKGGRPAPHRYVSPPSWPPTGVCCAGEEPLAPRADLGHAASFLYMLAGEEPSPERARGLETYLNTVTDHGLNASTFTARVIVSTRRT